MTENILDPIKMIWEQDVSLSDTRFNEDYIHVSSIANLCPRAHYFAHKLENKTIAKEVFSTATKITFAIGRALEIYFREQFIKSHGIENIFGMWKGELRFGTQEDTLEDYKEIEVFDDDAKLIGHIDWVYRDLNGRLTVLEIKSISKGRFETELKKGPIVDHVIQVLSYVKILSQDPRVKKLKLKVNHAAHVYYMCKEYRFRSKDEDRTINPMYKCFTIQFKDYKKLLSTKWSVPRQAINAVKEDKIPPRTVCETYLKNPAKSCPYVCRCFMKE